jgi:uncharacterized iron-regulated membrane protein
MLMELGLPCLFNALFVLAVVGLYCWLDRLKERSRNAFRRKRMARRSDRD